MKKSASLIFVLLLAIMPFSSCTKDEPEPEDPGNSTPVDPNPPFFRWTVSPGSMVQADSAHAYVSSNVIFAFKNGSGTSMEIRLASMNTGSYSISSATGNQLEYQVGKTVYNGTGKLNITESSSSKLSGDFSCSLSGGTLTAISGSFASIPKRY